MSKLSTLFYKQFILDNDETSITNSKDDVVIVEDSPVVGAKNIVDQNEIINAYNKIFLSVYLTTLNSN